MNDHILQLCVKKEYQLVVNVLDSLERKYGHTWIERIKECIRNWLDFKEIDYDSDDELLFAIEEVGNKKMSSKCQIKSGFLCECWK